MPYACVVLFGLGWRGLWQDTNYDALIALLVLRALSSLVLGFTASGILACYVVGSIYGVGYMNPSSPSLTGVVSNGASSPFPLFGSARSLALLRPSYIHSSLVD